MKKNRPLSPHLTIYTPQLTSTLSIFHRITGALLASFVLLSILFCKICDLSLSIYWVYWCIYHVINYYNWLVFALCNLVLLALCYHMSNGIRHLLWDLGFFLDLSTVYTSGIVMLISAFLLAIFTFLRIYNL